MTAERKALVVARTFRVCAVAGAQPGTGNLPMGGGSAMKGTKTTAIMLAIMVLAGCASHVGTTASPQRPSLSPSPSPTPAPETTDAAGLIWPTPGEPDQAVNWDQLSESTGTDTDAQGLSDAITAYYAAYDTGTPGSAPYAGSADHPMAFVYTGDPANAAIDSWNVEMSIANGYADNNSSRTYAGNYYMNAAEFSPPDSGNPLLFTNTNQVQLIAVPVHHDLPGPSCGTYRRASDGATGQLRLDQDAVTITIYAALTGKVVAKRRFTSDPGACPGSNLSSDTAFNGKPPWYWQGTGGSFPVSFDGTNDDQNTPAIKAWIDSFLTGPVQK
jgi:hypothetical protein